MTQPPDDRSPLSSAMAWTSRITTIAMEMALPGLAGYWADRKLGTPMVFLVLGTIVGFTLGVCHLVKLGKPN